jgi:hypothetical protein
MKAAMGWARTSGERRCYYISGQPVELWEDPSIPFGWGPEELSVYAHQRQWGLLFNALVLSSLLDPPIEA